MARMLLAASLLFVLAVSAIAQDDKADDKAAADKAADKSELKTVKDKGSYSIGFQIGNQLKGQGMRPSLAALLSGIQDALKAAEPKIATGEMDAAVREFSIQSKTELAEMNKKEGEKFLAENGKKEGIVTLKSGLQYKVLAKGKEGGASPKADDQVTTHYHGTLIDGSVFDSSVDRGEPATFGVGMVIAGWTEALQLMKAGDKWQLFLPADLAYGVRGAGGSIGPNAALIFEVELIKIVE